MFGKRLAEHFSLLESSSFVLGPKGSSLAWFALWAIYKQAAPVLLILGALAGTVPLLDAGIGMYEHDLGKCAGPLFIAVLQFVGGDVLHRSVLITPQTGRG